MSHNTAGTNNCIVANRYWCTVQDYAVIIGIKIITNMNILPKFTTEIWINKWCFTSTTKKFSDQFFFFSRIIFSIQLISIFGSLVSCFN